ncbi:MAG: M3 family oligoendopeptidase [Candidatus Dormibacter sp.]|uniref:M3 family oligoendopeptidase n=1 Tax=Candidatus Dormibacter sp. TaxID=2973982 RepID=UPI000DB54AE6|nr:MAG: oligoendopeptidase F [Candidatus Dormibacteraeota bacterium]
MTETVAAESGAERVRWHLDELYDSPEASALSRTLAEALEWAQAFETRYKGRISGLAADEFAEMMASLETHYVAASKPGLYAHLLHTLDTRDHAAGRLLARVREAGAEQGRHMVFFGLEVAQLSDEKAEELYSHPSTSKYRHTIEQERRYRKHQLTEPEERVLTEFSPVASPAWSRLFEELCAAVRVELDGGSVPLSIALSRLRDGDRAVRERASHTTSEALRADLRTRAYIFNVLLQEKSISDRVRGYQSWISARNLANEISDSAVQALVEAVTGRYGIVPRYYRVKRRLLGLTELHEWDRYAPLEATTRQVDWDSAKDIVLSSYHRFSPRAGRMVEDFFSQGWIDAPVMEGKEGGAYCAFATPDLHPFIMLNFTGRLNDALTLAHELGHGLHDRLAGERNHLFDYHPPLTLAETASVFGETLTFDAIMSQEKDARVRLSLLCQQVEDSFATVFRQISMNRFEDAVHTARRSEGELAPEQIGSIWQTKLQAMFGDSVELTEEHRDWWSYVEHFVHTPGYVYAYAFGNLLALSIYRRYRELEDPAFVEEYLGFLGTGGSLSPEEAVRRVGLDISDPAFWGRGLDIVEGMVSEVERLAGQADADGSAKTGD